MSTRSRSDDEGNALLAGSGSAIAVPASFVPTSILEAGGYQKKGVTRKASDDEQRKSRKALARRWSEPYSDDGRVDLLDSSRFGLLVNYACIGFLNGLLPALVYPFFKLYLNMDGFQVSAAAAVLAAIPEGMRSVVAGFVTVEVAEQGFEGATYALLTTVHNLAWPFAQSVTNIVDANFDVSDTAIASDSLHVRWQVACCLFIAGGVQLLGLVTLILLPDQKQQAQDLKRLGGSSRLAARLTIVGIVVALSWATTTNILAIHSPTACLIIAGGQGC
ncbi:hypothetical protein PC111_g449 [Phytophthora cactorum]|nr:hypothetical protein PC111_g449 [Phytophthora cactorum]